MSLERRSEPNGCWVYVPVLVLVKEWSSVDDPLDEKRSGSLSKPSSSERVDVSAGLVCLCLLVSIIGMGRYPRKKTHNVSLWICLVLIDGDDHVVDADDDIASVQNIVVAELLDSMSISQSLAALVADLPSFDKSPINIQYVHIDRNSRVVRLKYQLNYHLAVRTANLTRSRSRSYGAGRSFDDDGSSRKFIDILLTA